MRPSVSINQGIGIVSPIRNDGSQPNQHDAVHLDGCRTGRHRDSVHHCDCADSWRHELAHHHLIILMMQNHSLDNLFGTYPGANGLNASLPSYHQVDAAGNTVSPTPVTTLATADLTHDQPHYSRSWDGGKMDKFAFEEGDLAMQYYDTSLSGLATDNTSWGISNLWSYAQQYALADNFYMSAMNSEPAQELYMVAATVDSNHNASALPFYDPCSAYEQQAQGAGTISVPMTETNVGDQLTAKQIPWTFYQTNYANSLNGTCTDYVPQEDPYQYFTSTENSSNIQNFTMSGFQSVLNNGTLPAVVWITPDGAHDMHPGGGNILDGIEWLSQLVQAVKSSENGQALRSSCCGMKAAVGMTMSRHLNSQTQTLLPCPAVRVLECACRSSLFRRTPRPTTSRTSKWILSRSCVSFSGTGTWERFLRRSSKRGSSRAETYVICSPRPAVHLRRSYNRKSQSRQERCDASLRRRVCSAVTRYAVFHGVATAVNCVKVS